MADLKLSCRCGKVQGIAHNASPTYGNRCVCYCKDCQAFARELNCADDALNEYGGTDILQMPPRDIEITQGMEFVTCLRLSGKGLYRWYAGCCNTPVGNTVGGKFPLVGLVRGFIARDQDVDGIIGPPVGAVFTESASKPLPASYLGPKSQWGIMLRISRKLLRWKLTGKAQPSPFFDRQGNPVADPVIVDRSAF